MLTFRTALFASIAALTLAGCQTTGMGHANERHHVHAGGSNGGSDGGSSDGFAGEKDAQSQERSGGPDTPDETTSSPGTDTSTGEESSFGAMSQ